MIEIEMLTSALDPKSDGLAQGPKVPQCTVDFGDDGEDLTKSGRRSLDGLQIIKPEPMELLIQEPVPLTAADITAKEQRLESMKNTIERMNKTQHIEVLKIFKKFPQIKLNENRNGVYINLSYLPDRSISELTRYIEYVDAQETNLETMEARKEEYKSFFSNS